MNDEIKDQRIGNLRVALDGVRTALSGFSRNDNIQLEDIVRTIDAALKADDQLAGNGPQPAGEQLKELAESHRVAAVECLCAVLEKALPGITVNTLREYSRDFVEEVVAAASYEAEARARARREP